jgi:hypothetical protein
MAKWFNSLPRLLQMLLLLIPGVNWVIEVLVRWDNAIHRKSVIRIIIAVLVTIFGALWGWVDFFWCLFFHHMTFAGN